MLRSGHSRRNKMATKAGRVLLLLLAFVFAVCSAPEAHAQKGKRKHKETTPATWTKIGFALDSLKVERWQTDLEAFQNRARQLGAEVLSADAEGDDELQFKQVEDLIQQGIKILVLVPHDSSKAARIVNAANAANVKVISYDRIASNSDVDLFVGFDPYQIGRMQADYLVNLAPKGNYVIVAGSPSDQNAKILHDEQERILQPYIDRGDIKIISDSYTKDWQASEAYIHMMEAIDSAKGNITAVLSSNDGMAGGAIQALEEQHLLNKVLVTG